MSFCFHRGSFCGVLTTCEWNSYTFSRNLNFTSTDPFFSGLRRIQETVKQVRADIAAKPKGSGTEMDRTDVQLTQNEVGASNAEHAAGDENLEDLVRTLHRQIQDSDWLKENTAEKWMADNPELAKEFFKQDTEK